MFRKLLDFFEAWIAWACGHRIGLDVFSFVRLKQRLGRKGFAWACGHRIGPGVFSSVGLKQRLGKKGLGSVFKSRFGLGRMRFRAGSNWLGNRPNSKKDC